MTKNIGIRTDEDRIKAFRQACEDLPLSFNPRKMIESYMDYVIDTSNSYRETGKIKFGFVNYSGNLVLCNLEGQQKYFIFERKREGLMLKNDLVNQLNDSPKLLAGLDSLYFFLEVNLQDYTTFYNNILLKDVLLNDDKLEMLSVDYSKQWTIYEHSNDFISYDDSETKDFCPCFRILFKNLNTRDNNHSILIQMDSFFMNYFGYFESYNYALDFVNSLGIRIINSHVNRVDLNTYVLDHNFEYLDYSLFSTKISKSAKERDFYRNGRLETFYLGSRASKTLFLRIYNKHIELNKKEDKVSFLKKSLIKYKFLQKYPLLKSDFKTLWNVEFECKREFLRSYNIDTVEQLLSALNGLHLDIMTKRIRLLERAKDVNNNTRIPTANIWNSIALNYKVLFEDIKPVDRLPQKPYFKDFNWLINRIEEYLNNLSNSDDKMYQYVYEVNKKLTNSPQNIYKQSQNVDKMSIN